MKLPRWMHRLYAGFFGYYWLPCRICGESYGGHEEHGTETLMTSFSTGWSVCSNPACSAEAKRRNEANDYFREQATRAFAYDSPVFKGQGLTIPPGGSITIPIKNAQ